MIRLLRSAFVIGRRDFTATVFSKAFLFFLIGPLFPILLGLLFGGIGARVADGAARPVVAVAAAKPDFERLAAAHARLVAATGPDRALMLERVDPETLRATGPQRLLAGDKKLHGVLRLSAAGPELVGTVRPDGATAAQMRLLLSEARAGDDGALRIVRITDSAPDARQRVATALVGQFLLFFLTILLAGMLLSQLIEEKSNKVIEVLAAAVPVDSIFLGKLFAMLATSLLGIAVWTAAGLGAIALFVEGGIATLPAPAVGWVPFGVLGVLYFAMNYLLLGAVFLSIGAQASTVREVQTLSMPITMLQVVILGIASTAIGAANSAEGLAVAAFPLSSPLAMVGRAAEQPALWPHAVGLAWQMLWVGLILHFGAGLFRRNVMKSGAASRRWWRRSRA